MYMHLVILAFRKVDERYMVLRKHRVDLGHSLVLWACAEEADKKAHLWRGAVVKEQLTQSSLVVGPALDLNVSLLRCDVCGPEGVSGMRCAARVLKDLLVVCFRRRGMSR